MTKLLVIQVAALSAELAQRLQLNLAFSATRSAFPALTCTAQADFRTGTHPVAHGMIANGVFEPRLKKILFWEQAASLVAGPRIWDSFRQQGGRVGLTFWQQSLGEQADLIISPRPIHKHSGGMIQALYTEPAHLEAQLRQAVGRPFNLMRYWGPLAGRGSSEWIVDALCALLHQQAPDLLLTYLPHLDYDLQRHGPDHPKADQALTAVEAMLARLIDAARNRDYDVLIYGDYAIGPVTGGAVFPNRALRQAGLFRCQPVKRMAYPDFFASRAFAMVDHEIAHVWVPDPNDLERAKETLQNLAGVESVRDRREQQEVELNHPGAGDLVLLARPGYWFAYPWWTDPAEAPDFAGHVDIHNKPGFDPCELFFGWPPGSVSLDTTKVKGTHGRSSQVGWASTLTLDREPADLADLGRVVGQWLGGQ